MVRSARMLAAYVVLYGVVMVKKGQAHITPYALAWLACAFSNQQGSHSGSHSHAEESIWLWHVCICVRSKVWGSWEITHCLKESGIFIIIIIIIIIVIISHRWLRTKTQQVPVQEETEGTEHSLVSMGDSPDVPRVQALQHTFYGVPNRDSQDGLR